MDLTCVECGYVGDYRTHYDIPKEPGKGICKDLDGCRQRQKEKVTKNMMANPIPPDAPKFTRDELHERHPRLVVKESKIGLGAFISSPVKEGGTVVDWSCHPLFQNPPRIDGGCYTQIAMGVYIGPTGPEEHPDTYINHSCAPNCTVRIERPEVHLVALRDISADEEITFDYAVIYEDPWQMECRCGTERCRRIIRGHKPEHR